MLYISLVCGAVVTPWLPISGAPWWFTLMGVVPTTPTQYTTITITSSETTPQLHITSASRQHDPNMVTPPPRPAKRPTRVPKNDESQSQEFDFELSKQPPATEASSRSSQPLAANAAPSTSAETSQLRQKLEALDTDSAANNQDTVDEFLSVQQKLDKEGPGGPTARELQHPTLLPAGGSHVLAQAPQKPLTRPARRFKPPSGESSDPTPPRPSSRPSRHEVKPDMDPIEPEDMPEIKQAKDGLQKAADEFLDDVSKTNREKYAEMSAAQSTETKNRIGESINDNRNIAKDSIKEDSRDSAPTGSDESKQFAESLNAANPHDPQEPLKLKGLKENREYDESKELKELKEPTKPKELKEPKQIKQPFSAARPEQPNELKEFQEPKEPEEPKELHEIKGHQPEDSDLRELKETEVPNKGNKPKDVRESLNTDEPQESNELKEPQEPGVPEEPKELQGVKEQQDSKPPKEFREPGWRETKETKHSLSPTEFENLKELRGPQEPKQVEALKMLRERKGLDEPKEFREPKEFEEFKEPEGFNEPKELKETKEFKDSIKESLLKPRESKNLNDYVKEVKDVFKETAKEIKDIATENKDPAVLSESTRLREAKEPRDSTQGKAEASEPPRDVKDVHATKSPKEDLKEYAVPAKEHSSIEHKEPAQEPVEKSTQEPHIPTKSHVDESIKEFEEPETHVEESTIEPTTDRKDERVSNEEQRYDDSSRDATEEPEEAKLARKPVMNITGELIDAANGTKENSAEEHTKEPFSKSDEEPKEAPSSESIKGPKEKFDKELPGVHSREYEETPKQPRKEHPLVESKESKESDELKESDEPKKPLPNEPRELPNIEAKESKDTHEVTKGSKEATENETKEPNLKKGSLNDSDLVSPTDLPPKPSKRPEKPSAPKPKNALASRFEALLRENESPKPKPKPRSVGSGRVAAMQASIFADLNAALSRGPPPGGRARLDSQSSEGSNEEDGRKHSVGVPVNHEVDANESADVQLSAMPKQPRTRAAGPNRRKRLPESAKPKLGIAVQGKPTWELPPVARCLGDISPDVKTHEEDTIDKSTQEEATNEEVPSPEKPTTQESFSTQEKPTTEENQYKQTERATNDSVPKKEVTQEKQALEKSPRQERAAPTGSGEVNSKEKLEPESQNTEQTPEPVRVNSNQEKINTHEETPTSVEGVTNHDAPTQTDGRKEEVVKPAQTDKSALNNPDSNSHSNSSTLLAGSKTELRLRDLLNQSLGPSAYGGNQENQVQRTQNPQSQDMFEGLNLPSLGSLVDRVLSPTSEYPGGDISDESKPTVEDLISMSLDRKQENLTPTTETLGVGVNLSQYLDKSPGVSTPGASAEVPEEDGYFVMPKKD